MPHCDVKITLQFPSRVFLSFTFCYRLRVKKCWHSTIVTDDDDDNEFTLANDEIIQHWNRKSEQSTFTSLNRSVRFSFGCCTNRRVKHKCNQILYFI